jgi:intein/homing endonuclease
MKDKKIMKNNGCLIAGTKIRMAGGALKNVEDVVKGDFLTGYDATSLNAVFVQVQTLKPNRWDEYYVINGRLKITYEHPVMVKDKIMFGKPSGKDGLFEVEKLVIGDKMVRYDGTIEKITSITKVQGETPTYNFVVDGNHLYIADDIVVHNPTVQKF